MRAKINKEGNKLDITIKGCTFTKYLNKCILCGKESIDDTNKGARHICDKCYKLFEDNKTRGKAKVIIEKEVYAYAPPKRKESKITITNTPIKYAVSMYNPSIKIENLVEYKNLMINSNFRINDKVMTVLVDLILKGVNTANKICKELGLKNPTNITTVRTYLAKMEMYGMLYKIKNDKHKGTWLDNVFLVNRGLVYTKC